MDPLNTDTTVATDTATPVADPVAVDPAPSVLGGIMNSVVNAFTGNETATSSSMSQEEIDERAAEADRLRRYALSDREGVARETAESEARLAAKYS